MKKAIISLGLVLSIAACGSGGSGDDSSNGSDINDGLTSISENEVDTDFSGQYFLIDNDCDVLYDEFTMTQNGVNVTAMIDNQSDSGTIKEDEDGEEAIDFGDGCVASFVNDQEDANTVNSMAEISVSIGDFVLACDVGDTICFSSFEQQ